MDSNILSGSVFLLQSGSIIRQVKEKKQHAQWHTIDYIAVTQGTRPIRNKPILLLMRFLTRVLRDLLSLQATFYLIVTIINNQPPQRVYYQLKLTKVKCSTAYAKQAFYHSANSSFGKVANAASEEVMLPCE